MKRRNFTIRHIMVAVVAVVFLVVACASEEVKPPNVMVIMADDLGFSDIGCYGGEIKTPNLDELAFNGLRFTQFNNTGRCWPSRAALLTGFYPQQVGRDDAPGIVGGAATHRPYWATLLPVHLKDKGYRSYHAGKWHIDGMPIASGFDQSYFLGDQGRFFSPKSHYENDQKLPPVERRSGYYSTIAIADKAIDHLREHNTKHADQPFFQYVAFTAPHFPLHALPEDIKSVGDRYESGWNELRNKRWERIKKLGIVNGQLSAVEPEIGPPYDFSESLEILGKGEVNRPVAWDSLTSEQKDFQIDKMTIHAAMVERMDKEIGRILDQLEAMDAMDNTLVIFLSDNGASAELMVRDDGHDPEAVPGTASTYLTLGPGWSNMCNTPFRRHKTWTHEGGTCTPFIAHWPSGISRPGKLRRSHGHITDIVPTILDLAGASPNGPGQRSFPGESLLPIFGQETNWQHPIWYYHEGNRALRVGNWKLVAAKDEPWELFDLDQDRTESHNLAGSNPEKVIEMGKEWNKMLDEIREDSPYKSTEKNKVSVTTDNLE